MLRIRYIYEINKNDVSTFYDGSKRPVACVVRDTSGNIGISICNKNDTFGRKMAVITARIGLVHGNPNIPNRKILSFKSGKRESLQTLIKETIDSMQQ